MLNAITKTQSPVDLARLNDVMTQAGQAANEAAARYTFADHIESKASNTERRKRADLALFETFLNEKGVPACDLFDNPQAWAGVTWGIVKAFVKWQLEKGYAIGSINGRLSTVRTYAKLAAQVGIITEKESILIASVKGYANKDAIHMDERRRADGIDTRKAERANIGKPKKNGEPRKATAITRKKAEAVSIPDDIAEALITKQPNTPQGRRDTLLMCLLLEHGLRVGEVAILTRAAFDLKANNGNGTMVFYRPKVNKIQTHELTPNTRKAAAAYLQHDAPADGILWRKSCKGTGKLSSQMSETSATRAINKRVELLGRHAGIKGLSPHDCRHYWVTWELKKETPPDKLMQAGGWNSPAMVYRYREPMKIANEGTARLR